MARVQANGIAIEYEIAGNADAPVMVLIHGVGAQLVRWPEGFCDRLVAAGFRVLRFDNRDIGLSSHAEGDVPHLAAVTAAARDGRSPELPYTLKDMAADTAGLLDALSIARAHVLGVSLGGMIAQVLAIEHPERVRSLAIVMSNSGNPEMPPANPETSTMLAKAAPDPFTDREAYLAHQVELNRALGSPLYPAREEELRAFAARSADRAWNPQGPGRQLAASRGAADRRAALRNIEVPTLVIHGADDPLIPVECGEDIAENVPGAWMLKIRGMGHDLPSELFDLFVATVAANAARAT